MGELFLIYLYAVAKDELSINSLHYKKFAQSGTTSILNLSSIPSTNAAVRLQTLRTYYQAQTRIGIGLHPKEWG